MLQIICVNFPQERFEEFLQAAPDWCSIERSGGAQPEPQKTSPDSVFIYAQSSGTPLPYQAAKSQKHIALVDETSLRRRDIFRRGFNDFILYPFIEEELEARLPLPLQPTEPEPIPTEDPLLSQTCAYLQDNILFADGIHRLARLMGTNRNTLNQCFKTHLGVGPMTWLRNLRLDTAAEEIARTSDSIIEIAFSVGFDNPNNFSTAFRRRFGCSPREHRQNCKTQRFS